jgi:hypothetical protein
MQLADLVKPLDQCTDEELLERLRTIRNNRTSVRPAAKAHAKRAERKGLQTRVSKVENLIAGLSPEAIQQLLLELGESNEQG